MRGGSRAPGNIGFCLGTAATPVPAQATGLAPDTLLSAGLVLITAVVVFVAWYWLRLVRALRHEMAERAQVERELRASERRHRLLVNAAPFPVVITRLSDGLLRFANPSAMGLLGIDPGSSTSHRAAAFYVQQSERRRLLAMLEAHGAVSRFEALLRSLDGREFWVELNATPLQYDGEDCIFTAFSDITERKALEQGLRRIADTDALTGVANRRRFLELLQREIAVRDRYDRPACVMSLDLDFFKQINDTHGHPVGDRVLTWFAQRVNGVLRAPDTLARLGGEEFAVLMRETRLEEALQAAERVRARVAAGTQPDLDADEMLTVSIGVTEIRAHDSADSVTERVDQLLYAAKESGRNRVCGD